MVTIIYHVRLGGFEGWLEALRQKLLNLQLHVCHNVNDVKVDDNSDDDDGYIEDYNDYDDYVDDYDY